MFAFLSVRKIHMPKSSFMKKQLSVMYVNIKYVGPYLSSFSRDMSQKHKLIRRHCMITSGFFSTHKGSKTSFHLGSSSNITIFTCDTLSMEGTCA